MKKAVGFVMENSDDFEKLLKLARDLPDDALGFLGRLPDLMKTIGSGLAEADRAGSKGGPGGRTRIGDAAAKRLNDGSGSIGGVATEIESLAGNLQDLSGILASVGEALAGLGTKLSESGGSVKTLLN